MVTLSATDRRRLLGYGLLHNLFVERTLDRYLAGKTTRESSSNRIVAAACALGITLAKKSENLPSDQTGEVFAKRNLHGSYSSNRSAQAR
jgi:hypothetical protein